MNVLASVIVAILILLSLILMATTLFPGVDVTAVSVAGAVVLASGLLAFGLVALQARRGGSRVTVIDPIRLRLSPASSGRCRRSPSCRAHVGQPVAERPC